MFDIEGDNIDKFGEKMYLAIKTRQRVQKNDEGGAEDIGLEDN